MRAVIDDISFSKQFKQAIEDKQRATPPALRAQQEVPQAEYEAESTVATAQGAAPANSELNEGLSRPFSSPSRSRSSWAASPC